MNDQSLFTYGMSLKDFLRIVWSKKLGILSAGIIFAAFGAMYAYWIAQPLYLARSVVAPKETDARSSSIFSQMSGMGLSANNMSWLVVILNTIGVSENVVANTPEVLPLLYPRHWDAAAGKWKASAKAPELRSAAALLRKEYLNVGEDTKRGLLTVSIEFPSAELSKKLVEAYLNELSRHVRENVLRESEGSRSYLDSLAFEIRDPLIRERIAALASTEIEKVLMVRSTPFQVLEPPIVPEKPSKPRKPIILLVSFLLGVFLSSGAYAVKALVAQKR